MVPAVRGVGIVRVSQTSGREGERFASPAEQRDRIKSACERDGLDLVETIEELDVSGGTPLEQREGLRRAVEMVEAGDAEVIVAAYFDRLVRSLAVQGEVVSRVEAAGGRVLAVDVGEVSGASAGQWLTGTFLGAVAEYQRRTTRERTAGAQARAVERGVAPWANIPPGYRRTESGALEPDDDAPAVLVAFELRAGGASITEVRAHLREHGIERTHSAVTKMLQSRVYLGEIHFGKLVNREAHSAIVSPAVFAAVQRVRVPRGPRAKSARLLAHLGVLRCGTCGTKLVVGASGGHAFYRCPPVGDCHRKMTISATVAEQVVTDAVIKRFGAAKGRASAGKKARAAEAIAQQAQADLDAAIRAFAGLAEEAAAIERLAELREARDRAIEDASHLRSLQAGETINLAADWERLTLEARRGVIKAAVVEATVFPGRGAERITVTLRE